MLQGHVSLCCLALTFTPFIVYAQNNLQNNLKQTGTNKWEKARQVRRWRQWRSTGLAGGDIWNQHYLAITCAIRRLEDVNKAYPQTDAPPCLAGGAVFFSAWLGSNQQHNIWLMSLQPHCSGPGASLHNSLQTIPLQVIEFQQDLK